MNVNEVRHFLGLAGCHGYVVEGFSVIGHPLMRLLKETTGLCDLIKVRRVLKSQRDV